MRFSRPLIGPCLILLLTALPVLAAGHEKPLELGSRLELFVDDFLIQKIKGLELKLHSPRPAGKILSFDKPWEGNSCFYTTVFRDGDRYLLYYRGSNHPDATPPSVIAAGEKVLPQAQQFSCVLESSDGIQWKRPSVGIFRVGVAPRLVLKYNIRPGLSQAGFLVSLARSCASR